MVSLHEIDLYCPGCGYNLRGLEGDPIRCPECGKENRRWALEVTEAEVAKHVRYMATVLGNSAVASAACFFLGFIFLIIGVLYGACTRQLVLPLCIVGLSLVAFNLVRFRGVCRARRGWLAGFWRFHAAAYGALLVFCLVWMLPVLLFKSSIPGGIPIVRLALALGLIAGIWFAMSYLNSRIVRPLYDHLIDSIEPFQSDIAEELLRLERRDERTRVPLRYRSLD
jgi:hypothetical protein